MEKETIIYDEKSKKRIIFTRSVSGEDKMREAVLLVMGPGYEYKNQENAMIDKQE